MELLARLLGGQDRVKIMRYFLHHEDKMVSLNQAAEKTKTKKDSARRELQTLVTLGFILKKKNKFYVSQGKKLKVKEEIAFALNKDFPHNEALKELLFDFQLLDKNELAKRFKGVGRIKLFVVSGLFLGETKSRVDVLIVGEALKKEKAEKLFETLSAELGREVIYALMDVDEYNYRLKMYDKFIRDVFEMNHEAVIDKLKEKVSS